MAASAPEFERQLLLWTQQSLQHHLYGNATFLAERLHAHAPSEDSAHVLATCHFSAGSKVRAYHLLQGCRTQHNRYLLALCCLDLGHLDEAERVLLSASSVGTAGSAHAGPAAAGDVPNGAAGLYLLGLVSVKTQRRELARRYFTQALQLNPYLWCAYEGLCQLGAELPPLGASAAAACTGGAPSATPAGPGYEQPQQRAHAPPADAGAGGPVPATPLPFSPPMAPFAFTPMSVRQPAANQLSPLSHLPSAVPAARGADGAWPQPSPAVAGTPMSESPDSPLGAPARRRAGAAGAGSAMGSWLLGAGSAGGAPPSAGMAGGGGGGFGAALSAAATPMACDDGGARAASQRKGARASGATASAGSAPPVRRSSRLSGGGGGGPPGGPAAGAQPARQPAAAGGGGAEGGDGAEGGEQGGGARAGPLGAEGGPAGEGLCPAACLLRDLAEALLAVSTYRCAHALQLLQRLPDCQRRTGWVLCQVGRAHFESVNYAEAERAFASALSAEPQRLAGHELHSTLLWHLRAEARLCALAQHATQLDRKSAHTWAILGNCFSLQKEHDTALRFLQRAVQLSPDFAYAHTLIGHEYAAIEDFDKALGAYRRAILLDERHYNGWYGLGSIYFRQEKYDLAEFHLARALQINPGSSPLQCYYGMAMHEKALADGQRPVRALAVLERAIELDPHNPLARFQKARVLLSLEERQLALEELLALREFAPKEGAVHLLLGRIYKKLGQTQHALVCMSTALDLNPKDAQMIKAAIHKLDSADDDDDVEDGP